MIINYKWHTYTKDFFKQKLAIYLVFLILFTIDIEVIFRDFKSVERTKDWFYYCRKVACLSIQTYFILYEFRQMAESIQEYLKDIWNYFELMGIGLYVTGATMDIVQTEITDYCKFFYVLTILFMIIKVLFLVRVFSSISFLVMMLIEVIRDLKTFLGLFLFFTLAFAECYRVL